MDNLVKKMAVSSSSFVACPSSSSSSSLLLGFLQPPSLSSPHHRRFRVSCCCSSSSNNEERSFPPLLLNNTISEIKNSGVIACLRAQSEELALEAAQAALRGGISVLEIVTSTPGVFQVVRQLVQEHPNKVIGVGTVLNAKDAESAINAGAKFLMSPATVKNILTLVQGTQVLYMPGVMTPTEILSAYHSGSQVVKIYPVSALGGTEYISAINKPFSHIPMVASQGVTLDSIVEYIGCGATAVVLSDAIFDRKAMDQGNFDVICQIAHRAAVLGAKAVERKRSDTCSS